MCKYAYELCEFVNGTTNKNTDSSHQLFSSADNQRKGIISLAIHAEDGYIIGPSDKERRGAKFINGTGINANRKVTKNRINSYLFTMSVAQHPPNGPYRSTISG